MPEDRYDDDHEARAPDRAALVRAASERLVAEAEVMRASARATREAATHPESRAENDKDTRGLEASYLARGQAMRVEELEEAAARLRFFDWPGPAAAVAVGHLVQIAMDDDPPRWVLLTPAAGGLELSDEGGVLVKTVTPTSPLGRALLERGVDDDFELRVAGRAREVVVLRIA